MRRRWKELLIWHKRQGKHEDRREPMKRQSIEEYVEEMIRRKGKS